MRYVDGLDFELDEVFGVFNRRLEIVALAHLAFPRPAKPGAMGAELPGALQAPSSAVRWQRTCAAAAMARGSSSTPCCMHATGAWTPSTSMR